MSDCLHIVENSSWHHLDKEKGLVDILWPPLTNIQGVLDVGIRVMERIPVSKSSHVSTDLLTPEQVLQLTTPTYNIRKEKQKSKDVLVDPASVTVVSQVEQEGTDLPSSHDSSVDLSIPAPFFHKELQDLDDKRSIGMARLEALIAMGQRPSPQPSFSLVKVPVAHQPPSKSSEPGGLHMDQFLHPPKSLVQDSPCRA